MSNFLMRQLMVNCKTATFLTARKEEGKLSLLNRIRLMYHNSMCSFCKRFEQQAYRIGKESRHIKGNENLPVFSKERISKMLDEFSS